MVCGVTYLDSKGSPPKYIPARAVLQRPHWRLGARLQGNHEPFGGLR